MPLLRVQITRILERLRKIRSKNTASSQETLVHAAEALEHVIEAVQAIDQRLQKLEKGEDPKRAPLP